MVSSSGNCLYIFLKMLLWPGAATIVKAIVLGFGDSIKPRSSALHVKTQLPPHHIVICDHVYDLDAVLLLLYKSYIKYVGF